MSLNAWLSSATSAAWRSTVDPLPGRERVDAAHQRGQPLERAEHAPQREQVDGEHERDADPQHRHLAAPRCAS